MKDPRGIAASILARLLKERETLDRLIPELTQAIPQPQDRALVQELCYGVARWYFRLNHILDQLLEKPLRNKDTDIRALMLCGLYQLIYLRIPPHAAVAATVEAAVKLKKGWAKQLVNAVLRKYQRESDNLQILCDRSPVPRFAHPDWFISAMGQDWPEVRDLVLQANNLRPPMHLRVNRMHQSRSDYLQRLSAAGIVATPAAINQSGICLSEPVNVTMLPGFERGDISVQDFGAQLAADLLELNPGMRVLDACAAPGGKTAHIHETEPHLGALVAVEKDARRVELLRETQRRLEIEATIIHGDAGMPASWWDGEEFDRILLDAPCSATGVIRRHPDIKILREPGMLPRYCTTQKALLESVWPLLRSGGKLLYATCSLLRMENDGQVAAFINTHDNVKVLPIIAEWGTETEFGRQTLPGQDETDGFYYAILEKP